MHDLHASKFHLIFFYRPRFTRFWHMNHTASQKPDLCSIGLGHSFALSLRKTIDKGCNSNFKKTKTHISCARFAPNFDEFGFHLESILASLKFHLECIFDVTSTCMRFFFAAFRRAKSWHFIEDSAFCIRRYDLTWNDSSNIIFSLAARSWKASPTSKVSKSKHSIPWNPVKLQGKHVHIEFLMFRAFFFSHEFSSLVFLFSPLQLPHETPWDQSRLLLPWPWNIKPRPDRERPVFSVNKSPFAMYLRGFILFIPSISQKP